MTRVDGKVQTMLKLFSSLRVLVYLKRISIALERLATLEEARLELEYPGWRRKQSKERPRMSYVDRPSVKDWNERYRKETGQDL